HSPGPNRSYSPLNSFCGMGSHRESLRHRARLVYRFLIFKAGVRVRDDAGAGLEVRFPVFQYGAAQRDARIDVTIEPEIADRARVAAATCVFQLADKNTARLLRGRDRPSRVQVRRAHVGTPVTLRPRMPSTARQERRNFAA